MIFFYLIFSINSTAVNNENITWLLLLEHVCVYFLYRLDDDHYKNKLKSNKKKLNVDYSYECEMHIFFDDAITTQSNGSSEPNDFVKNLISLVNEAAS